MARTTLPLWLALLGLAGCSGTGTDALDTGGDADDGNGETAAGGEDGDGDTAADEEELVTLTVSVGGGSSVQFFTNQGVRILCGETEAGTETPCVAQFVRGSSVDIQRTLSLPREEEARFRLASYSDDCADVDTASEPRGGHCRLTMDRDREVRVSFERRAELVIAHSSPDTINFRWSLAYDPVSQKGGGNPLTLQGTFDCYLPGPACERRAMFDVGTLITVRAGNGGDVANFKGWGGACATFGMNATCMVTLTGDSEVSGSWSYF
jgi:hypothetical protein